MPPTFQVTFQVDDRSPERARCEGSEAVHSRRWCGQRVERCSSGRKAVRGSKAVSEASGGEAGSKVCAKDLDPRLEAEQLEAEQPEGLRFTVVC